MLILRLKRIHTDLLKEEARKVHPIEACAILFERLTQKEAVVERVVVTSNKLHSTVSFEIDPETFVAAFTKAERGFRLHRSLSFSSSTSQAIDNRSPIHETLG